MHRDWTTVSCSRICMIGPTKKQEKKKGKATTHFAETLPLILPGLFWYPLRLLSLVGYKIELLIRLLWSRPALLYHFSLSILSLFTISVPSAASFQCRKWMALDMLYCLVIETGSGTVEPSNPKKKKGGGSFNTLFLLLTMNWYNFFSFLHLLLLNSKRGAFLSHEEFRSLWWGFDSDENAFPYISDANAGFPFSRVIYSGFTLPLRFVSFHADMRLMYDLDILLFYCTTLVVAYSEELDKGVKRLIAQGLNR